MSHERPEPWLTKRAAVLFGFVLLVISLFVILAVQAYSEYKDAMIRQQQEFLLEISKNAARSLEISVREQASDLKFLSGISAASRNVSFDVLLGGYYRSNADTIYGILLISPEGEAVCRVPGGFAPAYTSLPDPDSELGYGIGRVFEIREGFMTFPISVEFEGMPGFRLAAFVNTHDMYERIIKPIRTGVTGYTLVKDSEGTIIMHPLAVQVGIDVIDGRREMYPGLDFSDLEKLIARQLSGEEGYALYRSYWWADVERARAGNEIRETLKLNGFTPASVGGDFWVVGTTLDYGELDFPITSTLGNLMLIVLIILAILVILLIVLLNVHHDRKKMRAELTHLKELNTALEDLQSSRQQLSHYQQLTTIGTFTSGIAHEINNLLMPILGYSELMMKSIQQDTESFEDVKGIHEAALKAKEIMEQILIFSKRSKDLGVRKYTDAAWVLDESIRMIKNFIPPNIKLIKENAGAGYLYCNETQINQVLMNLYTNGYQSMEKNGGSLTVRLERVEKSANQRLMESDSEHFARIVVEDTGNGVEEAHLDRIFTPFFTTKGRGTGLGLFVAHRIVLSHKGVITVDSRVGVGSKFTVYLPSFSAPHLPAAPEDRARRGGSKMDILIVDDDKRILRMLKRGLSEQGYRVDSYADSALAVEQFYRAPYKYQVVITDFAMPKINGAQLSRIIKQSYPEKKVILMSGFLDEELASYRQEGTIDGYLLKPFSPQDLSALLDDIAPTPDDH